MSTSLSSRTSSGADLSNPCAHCPGLSELIVFQLEGRNSLVSSSPSDSYILSDSSSTGFPEPKEEGIDGEPYLGLSLPRYLCLHIVLQTQGL